MSLGVGLAGLQAVEAIGRLGSVTAAAAELGISQPAVSQRLAAVEARLNLRLFERRGTSLQPTADGALLLQHLAQGFAAITEGLRQVQGARASGPVTVNLLPSFAVHWLIPRLGQFQADQPAIEIRLVTTIRPSDFRDDVDLGIRYGRGDWPGLTARLLMTEEMFPVAAPGLVSGDLASLAELPQIVVDADPRRQDWPCWLAAAGAPMLQPRQRLLLDNSSQALAAACSGLGVALAHGPVVAADLAAGRLVAPFALKVTAPDAYWLVSPAGRPLRPPARRFRDWLLKQPGETAITGPLDEHR